MLKIYLGTSGVPISAKDRKTISGIEKVHELGLNAMEVEFVHGVRMSNGEAEKVGEYASTMNVRLSAHAPYFINLCSDEEEKRIASIQRIYDTAEKAFYMKADAIAVHAGFYGKKDPGVCYERIKEGMLKVLEKMESNNIRGVKIGIETMAKESAFGTFEEVMKIYKEIPGVYPYIDWAHTYARQNGNIDYGFMIKTLLNNGIQHINSHFEALKFKNGKYVDIHEPMEDGSNPTFEPLAKELVKSDLSITLICESPQLEYDALKMKSILEKNGYKL
jgi:deoxyribonuclease-4